MKLLWYITRLNLGGAESLTITVLNFLSKFHSVILVTDIKKSSEINQIKKKIKIINLDDASGLLYFLKFFLCDKYSLRVLCSIPIIFIFKNNNEIYEFKFA